MICCVPVGQAEVQVAAGTDAGYQLLLLTLRLVALVAKHLVFLLLLTVLLDVSRHSQVWNSSTGNWNWRVAKGANRHLRKRKSIDKYFSLSNTCGIRSKICIHSYIIHVPCHVYVNCFL